MQKTNINAENEIKHTIGKNPKGTIDTKIPIEHLWLLQEHCARRLTEASWRYCFFLNVRHYKEGWLSRKGCIGLVTKGKTRAKCTNMANQSEGMCEYYNTCNRLVAMPWMTSKNCEKVADCVEIKFKQSQVNISNKC